MKFTFVCSLLVAFVAPLSAQQTWIVDAAGGAGAHFRTITGAVAIASSGDVVVVRAGSYSPPTLSVGLRLLGEPGATIGVVAAPLRVRDLPATDVAVVRGFTVASASTRTAMLWLTANAGAVFLEDLVVTDTNRGGAPIVSIEDCAAVAVSRCAIDQGLRAVGSSVVITGCHIERSSPMSASASTLASVSVERSRVTISASTVLGEDGGLFQPQPALSATVSSVRLLAGVGSSYTAGARVGSAVAALAGDLVSKLEIDPAVALNPSGGSFALRGFGDVNARRMAALAARGGVLGGTVAVELRGPQGHAFAVLVGVGAAPVAVASFGLLWLAAQPGVAVVGAGAFGAGESWQGSFTVPTDAGLRGVPIAWQALTGALPVVELSNVVTTAVR